jgi:cell division cycle 14
MTSEEVVQKFASIQPSFIAYRDASYGPCSYKCTFRSCIRGLEFAIKGKFFDINTFDLKSYEFYEKIQNGDMNWIIPDKLLAFSTPNQNKKTNEGVK